MKLIQRMLIKQLLAVLTACVVAVVLYMVSLSIQINAFHPLSKQAESLDQTIARMQVYKQLEQRFNNHIVTMEPIDRLAVDTQLQHVNAYLVVVENNKIGYVSKSLTELNQNYLVTQLEGNINKLEIGKQTFEVFQLDVTDLNQNYYFLFELTSGLSATNISFIIAAAAFFISYFFACLYILHRLDRKLINPIVKLNHAALKISEGELDSIIAVDTQGEIDELARSLEFLRLKLKESILLQKKYDDNRSFLISSISHDLRTPVTTIKGYVEALRDGIANTPEKRQHYLHIIDKKANQINEMIEDLLLYSKLDLNQIPFSFTKINVINYLQDGLDDYSHFFAQHQVTVSLNSYVTESKAVLLDLNRFMRVIQNIWNNAIIYNDKEQKQIEMNVRETYSSVVIEIKDNGKGLNEEDARRIFERFYRSDRARQTEQGSGLGLAIAKHIIDEHKGHIWAKGKLGEGTSIFISLPKSKE